MKVGFTTHHRFDASPDRLFDFTNDAANFTSFAGFGPIPGIRKATYETAGVPRLGSKRRILKNDGTEHIEEITAFERPARHTSRITGLSPPFSWLVRFGEDHWKFAADESGTVVERTFAFELTSPLAAFVAFPLLHFFMRMAVRRDLRNIGASL